MAHFYKEYENKNADKRDTERREAVSKYVNAAIVDMFMLEFETVDAKADFIEFICSVKKALGEFEGGA